MPLRRRIKLGIKITVTSVLLVLIFTVVEWDKLWAGLKQFDPGLWALVWVAFLGGHLVGVFKWRLNVNIGRAGLRKLDAVQCYFAGLFANLCLPSIVGGDALKTVLAGRLTGRYESAVFGALTERLIDTFALLVLIVIGSLLSSDQVPGWAGNVLLVGGLIAVASGFLFLPLALRTKLERLPRRVRRPAGRAMVAMRRLWRQPRLAVSVLAMSLGIQSWFVLLNMWLAMGLGIDVPVVFWFLAVPLTKAVTLAPISLGGFGVREATLAAFLGVVGVSKEDGVLTSLLWQTVIVATGLLGGAIWFLLGLREEARAGGKRSNSPREDDRVRAAETNHA